MQQHESAETQKIPVSNIIRRREIEPLLLKAYAVVKSYEKATGTVVAVLDRNHHPIGEAGRTKTFNFCTKCRRAEHNAALQRPYPCTGMHIAGIAESRQTGGLYIYMCEFGFVFWTSPLFSNGRSLGALIAGGVLGIDRQKAAAKLCAKYGTAMSLEDAEKLLAEIPEKTSGEIKALARALLLCAEQVFRDTEEYTDTMMRMAEQESCPSNHLHLIKDQYSCYPIDKERILLAALRRGDREAGKRILNDLLEDIQVSTHYNFTYIQQRALELVVLLSRSAVSSASAAANTGVKPEDNGIFETNNRYLKRIQDARDPEELTDILHLIVDRMAGQIFSFQGVRHASALRKAERYIWENYTRKISLKEIAAASGLSAPYFSSVFKEEMGENLSNYLNRLRVERASALLTESDLPLNKIAGVCGFEDQSWFSKIFKSYTGISPGCYRAGKYRAEQGEGSLPASRSIIHEPEIPAAKETG
ncbi:hypothetical protein AGMMS50267_07840 [Spirochaetia bacterium]|nr:hypothetical protein AGMMS50267_07840 [Spirochaetia bacterium]